MRLLSYVILLALVMFTDALSAARPQGRNEERNREDRDRNEQNFQDDRHRQEFNDRDLYNRNEYDRGRPMDVNVNGAGSNTGGPNNPYIEQVPVYPTPTDGSTQQ